jgi:hypothetical protein
VEGETKLSNKFSCAAGSEPTQLGKILLVAHKKRNHSARRALTMITEAWPVTMERRRVVGVISDAILVYSLKLVIGSFILSSPLAQLSIDY